MTPSDFFNLAYFIALNGTSALFLVLSALELAGNSAHRMSEMAHLTMRLDSTPPISLIAPTDNEAEVIANSVRARLALEYPRYEVIVVNDGSKDATLEILKSKFELVEVDMPHRRDVPSQLIRNISRSRVHPKLVVDRQNAGKADALNAGINVSRTPLMCCVDADSRLDRCVLMHLVEPFISGNGRVMATGGAARVINGARVKEGTIRDIEMPKPVIARMQIIEYLRAFVFARLGLNRLGGNLIISGAMGLFRRQVLVDGGGEQIGCIGEDRELIVRAHRRMRELGRP